MGDGCCLYIPAGLIHGFRCTEGTLHLPVAFPAPQFVKSTIAEDTSSGA